VLAPREPSWPDNDTLGFGLTVFQPGIDCCPSKWGSIDTDAIRRLMSKRQSIVEEVHRIVNQQDSPNSPKLGDTTRPSGETEMFPAVVLPPLNPVGVTVDVLDA